MICSFGIFDIGGFAMADQTAEKSQPLAGPRPEPVYQWFTPVPQKWFALVVRGGDLHRIIHGVKGWYVDENFEFREEKPNNPDQQNVVSLLRAVTGREFVGIPGIQGLFRYKFAWNKFWRKEEGGKETPEYDVQTHDPENIVFTPFESQYPLIFGGIEVRAKSESQGADEALIPITVVITVRVRMIDPETALMTNIDWLGGVLIPNMQRGIKNFAGEKTYDDLIRGGKENIATELTGYIMGTEGSRSPFKLDVLRDAGVEIISIAVTDIIPNKEFEQALLKLAEAQRNALATIAEAEGKKKARILEGEGEAAYIEKVAEAEAKRIKKTTIKVAKAGSDAVTVEKWRQIHGSGITTYVDGSAGILIGADGKPVPNQ